MTAAVLPASRRVTRLRTAGLMPALLALVVGTAAWYAATPYVVGVFHDDGVYALLAKAIAEGRGFHYLQLPGAPAATHYPPLYPLLLGLLWWISPAFPENLSFLLAANAACLAASALGLYAFARRRLDWEMAPAVAVSLVAHLSVPILTLSNALLSESLFLALLWPSLLLAVWVVTSRLASSGQVIGAGVAAATLMLCRTIAVALVLAVLLLLAQRGRWRHVAHFSLASGAALLPWTLWTLVAAPAVPAPLSGAYGSYGSFAAAGAHAGGFRLLGSTVAINLREVALTMADRIAPGLPGALALPALLVFVVAIVAGAWQLAHRAPVTLAFVAAYLGIVLVTAFTPWRYLFALWPLLLVIAAAGARRVVIQSRSRRMAPLAMGLLAVPAAGLLLTESRALSHRAWQQPAANATRQVAPLVEWVRASTLPADVVLAEGAEVITLFTGRRAAPPVEFAAADYVRSPDGARTQASLLAMLRAVPATYLVTFSPSVIAAARSGLMSPRLLEAGRFPGGVAFRVVR